jgi:hypothetical protein
LLVNPTFVSKVDPVIPYTDLLAKFRSWRP